MCTPGLLCPWSSLFSPSSHTFCWETISTLQRCVGHFKSIFQFKSKEPGTKKGTIFSNIFDLLNIALHLSCILCFVWQVFSTLALVGMLILPLNAFPWVLNGTLEAKVSLDRIQRFLTLQDQDLSVYYSQGT